MKVMQLADSKDDLSATVDCMMEIDGVKTPFADTLNMENGLQYSQFLEAILRIAYYKKNENSEQAGNVDGFKNTLEAIFAETELDLKKRQKLDPVLEKVVQLSHNGYWSSKYFLLAGIFETKGMLKGDHLELAKQDFIALFNEAKITMKPAKPVEETKGGKGDKGKEPRKF
jgi:hypothetical protein